MGGKGPAPKPSSIRQRANKKAGATKLKVDTGHSDAQDNNTQNKAKPPTLQNPDKRKFHRLTRAWWKRVWNSPMANEYLETDVDGLARVAILIDNYYKILEIDPMSKLTKELMSEIRLQEARFGLSPVDRSRLQWEVQKGEEAEAKRRPARQPRAEGDTTKDPRGILGVVK